MSQLLPSLALSQTGYRGVCLLLQTQGLSGHLCAGQRAPLSTPVCGTLADGSPAHHTALPFPPLLQEACGRSESFNAVHASVHVLKYPGEFYAFSNQTSEGPRTVLEMT